MDAAIRHYQLGHWNVPGDFNPAAALPVWPALELVLFRFTGVSLAAARALTVAVFGLILACSYLVIRRYTQGFGSPVGCGPHRRPLAPAIAVLLLAVSPFCYVFSRLAILEPLLILLMLVALLVAPSAGTSALTACSDSDAGQTVLSRLKRRWVVWSTVLGLLLPLMVLAKTTGLFLFPAIFWLLWASSEYRIACFLRTAALACGVGIAAWGGYFLLFVRPRYLIDYRYLFSANAYTGITLSTFWTVISEALLDVSWIGATLSVLALLAVVGTLAALGFSGFGRGARFNSLPVALLLWIFGYGAFLTYHANLQPRYYLVLAIPLTLLTAIAFDFVIHASVTAAGIGKRVLQLTAIVSGLALIFVVCSGGRQTLAYVRNPEYAWWNAAQEIRGLVDGEMAASQSQGGAAHSRMVLSISGSDLSLMTDCPRSATTLGR